MEVCITKTRVALAALFVLAGVGLASLLSPLVESALANVGQVVNISDHSSSAFFAKVDSTGKLAVGDGAGPLSVDGTVTGRSAAPASPWFSRALNIANTSGVFLAGPSASPINVTSLSISTDLSTGNGTHAYLFAYHVPSGATGCALTLSTAPFGKSAIWATARRRSRSPSRRRCNTSRPQTRKRAYSGPPTPAPSSPR